MSPQSILVSLIDSDLASPGRRLAPEFSPCFFSPTPIQCLFPFSLLTSGSEGTPLVACRRRGFGSSLRLKPYFLVLGFICCLGCIVHFPTPRILPDLKIRHSPCPLVLLTRKVEFFVAKCVAVVCGPGRCRGPLERSIGMPLVPMPRARVEIARLPAITSIDFFKHPPWTVYRDRRHHSPTNIFQGIWRHFGLSRLLLVGLSN